LGEIPRRMHSEWKHRGGKEVWEREGGSTFVSRGDPFCIFNNLVSDRIEVVEGLIGFMEKLAPLRGGFSFFVFWGMNQLKDLGGKWQRVTSAEGKRVKGKERGRGELKGRGLKGRG